MRTANEGCQKNVWIKNARIRSPHRPFLKSYLPGSHYLIHVYIVSSPLILKNQNTIGTPYNFALESIRFSDERSASEITHASEWRTGVGSKDFYRLPSSLWWGGSGMRTAFGVFISLIVFLSAAGCYAQSMSYPLSLSGDFSRNWISSFKAQNPLPAEQNLENDLWTWGGAPKGSILVNGNLVPDPYYIWKSLNYTSGWLGKVYVDPTTGYPIYGYINPYSGMVLYYYMDPKTGKPVYTNAYPSYGFPNYGSVPYYYSSYYLPTG